MAVRRPVGVEGGGPLPTVPAHPKTKPLCTPTNFKAELRESTTPDSDTNPPFTPSSVTMSPPTPFTPASSAESSPFATAGASPAPLAAATTSPVQPSATTAAPVQPPATSVSPARSVDNPVRAEDEVDHLQALLMQVSRLLRETLERLRVTAAELEALKGGQRVRGTPGGGSPVATAAVVRGLQAELAQCKAERDAAQLEARRIRLRHVAWQREVLDASNDPWEVLAAKPSEGMSTQLEDVLTEFEGLAC